MSIMQNTKRSVGMVLGDFFAFLGIMAFMSGIQTLGAVLLVGGIGIYLAAVATKWMTAQLSTIWRLAWKR